MEHTLRISVSKEPVSGGIVSCRHISVRERIARFLLGEKRRLTIIVPGDSVRELAVSEIMEGGLGALLHTRSAPPFEEFNNFS